MATTTATKNSSDAAKAAPRKNGTRKTASASKARRPGNRSRSAHGRTPDMGWAATVASVIGVGVAVGVGLFATRRQWLPKAEEWGGQIADRFAHGADDDDLHEYDADLDAMADRDDDDWDGKVSRAAYPDRDSQPGTGASMLS